MIINVKEEILRLLEGDSIEAISICFKKDDFKVCEFFYLLYDEALKLLDYDYEFGRDEFDNICVWSKNWIVFKCVYDSEEWLERIPRNPIPRYIPESFGGC